MLITDPPATAGGTDSDPRTIRDFSGKAQLCSHVRHGFFDNGRLSRLSSEFWSGRERR